MGQKIITAKNGYSEFDEWLKKASAKKVLLVCDDSIRFMNDFDSHLHTLEAGNTEFVRFKDFQPNPLYENVMDGVRVFRDRGCDSIMAVGGGSAMDVAKCIKAYAKMQGSGECGEWLDKPIETNSIHFLAMPTTAGTGSEATRYAVIYFEGKKQSVTSDSFIPEAVLMDPSVLKTLPLYQKKATMMDAFSHALESFWSVNSTEESKEYSKKAIKGILRHMKGYLANTEEGNAGMLKAAHIAGKAVNITQTTAGHVMCYKITSLFGCAHGHAAALCDRVLFSYMTEHTSECIDKRGEKYLRSVLDEIGMAMGCKDGINGAKKFCRIFDSLELEVPAASDQEFEELKNSVNPDRLKNHPIALDIDTIDALYHEILKGKQK